MVPALHKHSSEVMASSEIHVTLYVFSSSAMFLTRFPGSCLHMVAPPYTYITLGNAEFLSIFHRTGLIEVEHDPAEGHVAGIVGDYERSPRGDTDICHKYLLSALPGSQRGCEGIASRGSLHVHGGVIGQISLM